MTQPTCANCAYFHAIEKKYANDGEGECRIRAPSAVGGRWAHVAKEDWCGEHTQLNGIVYAPKGETP